MLTANYMRSVADTKQHQLNIKNKSKMTQENNKKEQATDVYNMLAAVRIKEGATEWMKERGYWLDDYPESIDGMTGKISGDYTNLCGDDKHYAIDITNYVDRIGAVGVNPMFIEAV